MDDRVGAREDRAEIGVEDVASTQLVFGGVQVGSRRAKPTISSISGLSLSAWTVLVPTFPVAPVTITFIFLLAFP